MGDLVLKEALRKQRILVTGASGFIGQHLTQQLLEYQCEVHATSRQRIVDTNMSWHMIDLTDLPSLQRLITLIQPKIIYHLASPPEMPPHILEDELYYKTIILGTYNLLTAASKLDSVRIILAGSAKEYGTCIPKSFKTEVRIQETVPALPATPYAIAKLTVSLMAQMYHKALNLPIVHLRLFSVYGPGMDPNSIVLQSIQAALKDKVFEMTQGKQKRDFVYVSDVVEGFLMAACTDSAAGRVINLCTGQAIPIRELVRIIYKLIGAKTLPKLGELPYRRDEIWNLCGDPALAKKLLCWQPQVKLLEGLKKTIQWVKETMAKSLHQKKECAPLYATHL